MPVFKNKIVAFIDVLGFSQLVPKVESGEESSLEELLTALTCLERRDFVDYIMKEGPKICPYSRTTNKDLDYRVTQISDCVIISCEATPVGIVNIIHHCATAILELLKHGLLCRGYITEGSLYHEGMNVIGSAYMRALEHEALVSVFSVDGKENGTPFVEIDSNVIKIVTDNGDECEKKMLRRYITSGPGFYAVYPFQLLQYKSPTGGEENCEQAKTQNGNVRVEIQMYLSRAASFVDANSEKAMAKFKYYCMALEKQLDECDGADELIELRFSEFPKSLFRRNQ